VDKTDAQKNRAIANSVDSYCKYLILKSYFLILNYLESKNQKLILLPRNLHPERCHLLER
jgi:hypothetical protein